MKFDREQFVVDLRALAQMKVPFLHQGCDPSVGMDCINAPRWAYRKQGLALPAELDAEFEHYYERPDGIRFMRIMRKWFFEIDPNNAQPGDLLIFYARKNTQHMAVKVTDDTPPLLVEAYRSDDGHIKRILEQPLDPRRRIAAAFRIPDFA